MPWRTERASMGGIVHHSGNRPGTEIGTHSMRVYPALTSTGVAMVSLHHPDATGKVHFNYVDLYPDRIEHRRLSGDVSTFPDPPPHDKTHRLRELVANHHKQHDSWPAILDEIESHPQLGPLMSEAISHHINARVS